MWFTRVKYVKTVCSSSRACGAGNFTCTALHKPSRKMYFKYYGIRQTISCWQKGQKWKTINQAGINECVGGVESTASESAPACHSTWISMEHTHPYSHYLSWWFEEDGNCSCPKPNPSSLKRVARLSSASIYWRKCGIKLSESDKLRLPLKEVNVEWHGSECQFVSWDIYNVSGSSLQQWSFKVDN